MVAAARLKRLAMQRIDLPAANAWCAAGQKLDDLVQVIACFPAILHHRFLSFGVVNPQSLLHTNTSSALGKYFIAVLCCSYFLFHTGQL